MFDEKPKMVDDPAKMGKKVPNYWDAAKRLLADPSKFLDSLITFDKDNIKDAIIQRIQPYIDMEEFTPEAVARVHATCPFHHQQHSAVQFHLDIENSCG